jgi:hypothetical protein
VPFKLCGSYFDERSLVAEQSESTLCAKFVFAELHAWGSGLSREGQKGRHWIETLAG